MTVRDLIERLEEMPSHLPVCVDGTEVSEVIIRDELHFTADYEYEDGPVVKIL